MALGSLNLLMYCNVGCCPMSDLAVLEALKYSTYSCVPICPDSTSAKANTGLPIILPGHQLLMYLWDGCVDCKLEFWCLVLDYIVLKFILCLFG